MVTSHPFDYILLPLPLHKLLQIMVKKRSKKKKATVATGSSRGAGYTSAETDSLWDVVEEVSPMYNLGWQTVERQHHTRWPEKNRFATSLKNKFCSLAGHRMPTGDPDCPPEIKRAKKSTF